MADIPNLAGIATDDLVQKIGGGSFQASYINWARTLHLLHVHAPGWMPNLMAAPDGGIVHRAPVGGYLKIGFVHLDGTKTPAVPQAVMDQKNNAIPYDSIDARDVTDTHVRGVCKAAAFTFGLAYELWARMPLESGHAEKEEPKQLAGLGKPQDGMSLQDFPPAMQMEITAWANDIKKAAEEDDLLRAVKHWKDCDLENEAKTAVWFLLGTQQHGNVKLTTAIKRLIETQKVVA
jgi:hypothetical protein